MASFFISHSSQDNAIAQEVRDRLKARGYESLFLDFDPDHGIPAGRDWEAELYSQLRMADAVIFLGSPDSVLSHWCFAELALARSVDRPVFPLLVRGNGRHPLLADTQWIDLAADIEAGYERLLASFARHGFDPLDPPVDPNRPPYPGLAPFDVRDAGVFFGREREVEELLGRLHPTLERPSGRLIVLIGPSGSGKSSVLRGGLIPRVSRLSNSWVVIPPFVPGDRATASLAHAIAESAGDGLDPRGLEKQIKSDPAEFVEALVRIRDARLGPNGSILLPIDQAEELATRTPPGERKTFVRLLESALDRIPRLWIVATARADLLGAALQQPDDPDLRFEIVALKPLDRANLPRVIEGPASRVGLDFEPGLVGRMVEDTKGGDALPFLAYTLQQLWERASPANRRITERDYEAIGGVDGAVRSRADSLMSELTREGSEAHVVPTLLRLTEIDAAGEPARRRLRTSQLDDSEQKIVDAFVGARLLRSQSTNGDEIVEVAHEALMRAWAPLREAIENARDLLRLRSELGKLATEWDLAGRRDSYLLRNERLARVRQLVAATDDGLEADELERAFLSASIALAEREQSRRRRVTIALAALATVATAAAVATVVFGVNARNERQAAESRRLAAEANAQLGIDPQQSLAQALQAADLGRSGQVENALRQALAAAHSRTVLRGHEGVVNAAAFSPRGGLVITAGQDGTARVWESGSGRGLAIIGSGQSGIVDATLSSDGNLAITSEANGRIGIWRARSGQPVRSFNPRPNAVNDAAFTSDRRLVATAGADGVARVLTTEGALRCELKGHTAPLNSVTFDSKGIQVATASEDGSARVWTVGTCRPGQRLAGLDRDPLNTVGFSPDGSRLVTGDASGRARVWRIHDGRLLSTLEGHTGGVVAAMFSPDGMTVLTAGADGIARLWDPQTSDTKLLASHTDALTGGAFSRDGRRLVTGSADGTARVWARTGEELAVLRGHQGIVSSVAFDRSGKRLVSASADKTARVWELPPRELVLSAGGPKTRAVSAVASNDTVAVTGDDVGAVRLWNASTGDFVTLLGDFPSAVASVVLSGDGSRLLAASHEGAARVWDVRNRRSVAVLGGPRDALRDAAISSDGTLVVTAGQGLARLWRIDGGGHPAAQPLGGHTGLVESVAIRPRGRALVATGDDGGSVRIWDPQTLTTRVLGDLGGRVVRVGFSESGTRLLAASADGTAHAWDVESEREVATVSGLGDSLEDAAFSPDGTLVVAAGADPALRVVRIDSGAELATLVGHTRAVVDVEFSPDGGRIVTASQDGTARVWVAAAGEQQGVALRGHTGPLTAARFGPNGDTVITASEDGTARLVPCWLCGSFDDLRALARSRAEHR